jgi:tetratricopeptide (TPR) repeat protein
MSGAAEPSRHDARGAQRARPAMMPPVLDTPRARTPARAEELADPRSDDTIERLTYRFFNDPPGYALDDAWLCAPVPPLSTEMRGAMIATIAMLVVGALSIGSYLIYHRVIMPVPVELGQVHRIVLPSPEPDPDELAQTTRAARPTRPARSSAPAALLRPEASLMLAEGDALRARGDVAGALAIYERADALWPELPATLVRIAETHLQRGDARTARVFAERATDANVDAADAWAVLAGARAAIGDSAGARDAFQTCASRQHRNRSAVDCSRFMR